MQRSFNPIRFALALLATFTLTSLRSVAAQTYSITDLGVLSGQTYSLAQGINKSGQVTGASGNAFIWQSGALQNLGNLGGADSIGNAINTSGQVAGYSEVPGGGYRAFLYSGGKMIDLGSLDGGNDSAAYSLNDAGDVVGFATAPGLSGAEHAFLYRGGKMTDLGTLGGVASYARGINTAGQVVGLAYNADGNFRAFLYHAGHMADLGTLGGDWSDANAINDAGQVTGEAYIKGNVGAHAFLWQNGIMKDLGTFGPSSHYGAGLAINAAGVVVGRQEIPTSNYIIYHAFIYRNGKMTDLNKLIPAHSGWNLEEATGINDSGQIVGSGTHHGQSRAFLLTPR